MLVLLASATVCPVVAAQPSKTFSNSAARGTSSPHAAPTPTPIPNTGASSTTNVGAQNQNGGTPLWLTLLFSGVTALIASLVAGGVAFFAANRSYSAVQRTLWQKANEEELTQLQKRLDVFYAPFLQISRASNLMAQDLRNRIGRNDYRMLLYLMKPGWFAGLPTGDQVIVKDVCANGERLEKLIIEKSGVVDQSIGEYLGRASVHFRMLNHALKGELGSDPANFTLYIFPEHLTEVMEAKANSIIERCTYLRQNPVTKAPKPEPLLLKPEWSLAPWPETQKRAQPNTSLASGS